MSARQFKIIDSAGELRICVRFIPPVMTAVMVGVLALFWGLMFHLKGLDWGLIAAMLFTSLFAWLIGFGKTWLSLQTGAFTTYTGPIPFDRVTRDPLEIDNVAWTLIRAPTGRGGASERYALTVQGRNTGPKPVPILYGFMKEADVLEVAALVTARLNKMRNP